MNEGKSTLVSKMAPLPSVNTPEILPLQMMAFGPWKIAGPQKSHCDNAHTSGSILPETGVSEHFGESLR